MAKVDWDDEGLDLASIFNFPDESMESWEGEEWDAFTSQNLGPIPEDFVIDPTPNTPSYPLKSGTTPETYQLDDADGLYVFQQNESSPSPVSLLNPRTASKRKRSKRARPSGTTSQWNLTLPILYTERANDAKRANGRRRNKPDTAAPAAEPRVTKKCSHCEITKTPQWREGPLGPKTLCNACGVRYRSGRLFPEYRPAASPTFVPSIHSNSHKKVVEMRNKGKHVERTQIEFNPVLSYLFDHTRL